MPLKKIERASWVTLDGGPMVHHAEKPIKLIQIFFIGFTALQNLKTLHFPLQYYIQDRLEMKLGPSKPVFHSYLIVLFYDLDCHILEF